MAIRYSSDFNAQIRKDVRNFNRRVLRAEKRGFRNLPKQVKVSELKSRYENRSDLVRELNRLRNLRRGDILNYVENQGGVKAISWQFDYVKSNLRNAKQYFEREYERVNKRVGRFPGERQYVDNIQAKLNLLEMNIDYMNQSQFRSVLATIDEFAKSPSKRKAEYRGFLSEVDLIMQRVGVSSEQRDKFFKKFEQLSPSQFLYAYDNNDIIGRIYELADSPKYGGVELNTTEEDAENLVNILLEEADDIVTDAKANMD